MLDRFLAASLAVLTLTASTLPTTAADYGVAPPPPPVVFESNVPLCTDPDVLAEVEDQFEYGAPRMLEEVIEIIEFRNLRETDYYPPANDRLIERRYCRGEVILSDQFYSKGPLNQRQLYYVIEYPLGFASIGWEAEGCVLGLDRWHIYGAECESLRPF